MPAASDIAIVLGCDIVTALEDSGERSMELAERRVCSELFFHADRMMHGPDLGR